MKSNLTYLLMLLLLLACGEGKPRIASRPASLDLGEIIAGKSVEGRFVITNPGSAALVISAVEGSCSCTSVRLTKKIIVPGDSALVHFSMKALEQKGSVHNRILLRNNSDKEFYFLHIKASVD